MIERDQIRAVLARLFHHADERRFLLGAEFSADEVEFVECPIVIATERHHHVDARLLGFRSIAKAIRPAPVTEPGVHLLRRLIDAVQPLRELLFETIRFRENAGEIFPIDEPGIEGIDVEDHAVFIAQPLEKG